MKILVIGEKCKDVHIYCKCERLCPEAPVPVLIPIARTENCGMAGNTAQNINSLLEKEDIISLIGSDSKSCKTRYIDKTSGYIITRIDEDDIHPKIQYLTYRLNLNKNCDAIVISDYNKGFLSKRHIKIISDFGKKYKIPTFLDSKKILGDWSKDIGFIKINNKEYNVLKDNLKNPEKFCNNLIVTLGDDGAICINKNIKVKGEKVPIYNLSGAGDSFMAGFVVKYLKTKDIKKSMIYANKVAAIAVSKQGVVAVNKDEVK